MMSLTGHDESAKTSIGALSFFFVCVAETKSANVKVPQPAALFVLLRWCVCVSMCHVCVCVCVCVTGMVTVPLQVVTVAYSGLSGTHRNHFVLRSS